MAILTVDQLKEFARNVMESEGLSYLVLTEAQRVYQLATNVIDGSHMGCAATEVVLRDCDEHCNCNDCIADHDANLERR